MKNKALLVIILLLTVFTVACSQETSSSSKQEVQDSSKVTTGKPSVSSEFVKDKTFKGGSESTNYTLTGIRKRPNSTATRIHMNFGIVDDGTKPGEPPVLAKKLPIYEISHLDSEQKIVAIFDNVKWDVSKNRVQELKNLAPIIKELEFETKDNRLHVTFTLDQTFSYRVLESNDPAGISIFIKPDTN